MLTTAITGAITAGLAWFGYKPSATQIAGLWVAVKICVVAALTGATALGFRKKKVVPSTPEA